MANFLLVHGAWQGAWVWPAVSAELSMRGHAVHTIDLPGSGTDQTPLAEVTLSSYSDAILRAIRQIGKRVTLVGHSMGGVAVTAAAERAADSLARIIYMCAFVPCNGDSLASLSTLLPHKPRSLVEMEGDGMSTSTRASSRIAAFMHDAPTAVASWASAHFQAQAIAPLTTPVAITEERYGKVPRSYIVCTGDHAIDPELQRVMAVRAGCSRVKELASSHSPFLSQPGATAEMLHRLVTEQ